MPRGVRFTFTIGFVFVVLLTNIIAITVYQYQEISGNEWPIPVQVLTDLLAWALGLFLTLRFVEMRLLGPLSVSRENVVRISKGEGLSEIDDAPREVVTLAGALKRLSASVQILKMMGSDGEAEIGQYSGEKGVYTLHQYLYGIMALFAVVIEVIYRSFYHFSNVEFLPTVAIMETVFGIMIIVSLLFGNRFILGPLQRIISELDRSSQDVAPEHIVPEGPMELRALATDVNALLDLISNSMKEMDTDSDPDR